MAVVIWWCVNPASLAWAADGDQARYRITSITLSGLDRTEPFVVRRELLVDPGDTASVGRIEESVQRVRNTHLFRKVDYKLVAPDDQSSVPSGEIAARRLEVTVDEKWTLLPIFAYARGGGAYRFIGGVTDDNVLGRYIGLGGQYTRLGETNSFYGWIEQPRLFGQRLRGSLDVGTVNSGFTLYDGPGRVDGGFVLERFTVGASLQKEWLWWLRTGLFVRWNDDRFSYDLISPKVRARQQRRGLPAPVHSLVGGLSASVGRIDNRRDYLFDGTEASVTFKHASQSIASSRTMSKVVAGLTDFERLPFKSNVGGRLAVGFGDINAVHQRFYLGGLDSIRGFPKDRFAGEDYWQANVEFRIPSIDTRWFVAQHLIFADAAGVSEDPAGLATLSGASAGVGLRIIVPKIQGFIARIDYAFPLTDASGRPLSWGGGQFF